MNTDDDIQLAMDALADQVKAGCAYQKIQLNALDWVALEQQTGFNLADFLVIVDTHAMQHTLKKHGTHAEILRGQKEILRSDFLKLPRLLAMPESISPLGLNRIGRECVGFEKSFDRYKFRAVMEIRSGRRELALVSLYTIGRSSTEGESVND